MGTYDTRGGAPLHDPAFDHDCSTELQDRVLEILEAAGVDTGTNDKIVDLIAAWETPRDSGSGPSGRKAVGFEGASPAERPREDGASPDHHPDTVGTPTQEDARLIELEDAVERLSYEMMNRVEIQETPLPGGLIASQSFIRVSYNDLRIALAAVDEFVAARGSLQINRVRAEAIEECARVAEWAHMVPPDGGSPTDEEKAVADEAARRIRSLTPPQQKGE